MSAPTPPLPAGADTAGGIRFTNIDQIKAANTASGRCWFSRDTVRHFKSVVESRVYEWTDPRGPYETSEGWGECRLWVESTRNYDNSGREYKIARFSVTSHDIGYVGGPNYAPVTHTFATKKAAMDLLYRVLAGDQEIR